jgi:DNA primase
MDQVDQVKSKVDIVSLINDYVPLKKSGRNYQALCPFHDEKTPSFMVSPELQIYKCFGCGAGGDAINFVEEYEKIDFWEALEILAKRVGVKLERKGLGKSQEKKKRLYEINHLAANFYHFILTEREEGKKALDYLHNRGIEEKTIKQFKLGFSPSHQNAVIKFLKKRGYENEEIRQTGLTAKGKRGDYERFYSRVVFPLFNHRGNIVGFSGRVIPGISPDNIAKYVNIPNTLLYKKGQNLYGLWLSKNDIRNEKEAVIVEGEFDLISPFQAGITNIVAIKGTAFTPEQAKLIKRYAETAVFALDADAAGSEAVKRSSNIAEEIDLEIKVAILPEGYKDPDDLAQDKPKQLKKMINKAVSVYDFVIQNALNNYHPDRPSDQRKILKNVLPFINQIENAVVKQHYLKQIADEMKVSLESVMVEANKAQSNKSTPLKSPQRQSAGSKPNKKRRLLLEEELISLIFSSRLWDYLSKEVVIDLISHPRLAKILFQAREYLKTNEPMDIKAFFESLPEELKPGFENIFFLVEEETGFDEGDIQETISELSREDCRQKLTEISNQLTDSEKKGNEEEVEKLEQKYVQISKKLSNLEKND